MQLVTQTGTLTGKFSKRAAGNSDWSYTNAPRFYDNDYGYSGNSAMIHVGSSGGYRFYYGLNLETIRNLLNIRITGFSFTFYSCKGMSSTNSFSFRFASGFVLTNSTNNTYTDLIGRSITIKNNDTRSYYDYNPTVTTKTEADIPEALTWMNSNLQAFFNGYTTNSFGVRMYASSCYPLEHDVTINYAWDIAYYDLVVSASAGGTVTGSATGLTSGTTRIITATPNAGYRFVSWNDGNTSATRTVTVTGDVTYTATFIADKINYIYIGTAQPGAVYTGTAPVRSIYVGTTKIYG